MAKPTKKAGTNSAGTPRKRASASAVISSPAREESSLPAADELMAQTTFDASVPATLESLADQTSTAVWPFANRSVKEPEERPWKVVSSEERRRLVAEAAYLKAEQRGFLEGDPERDWFEAEAEIDAVLMQSRTREAS